MDFAINSRTARQAPSRLPSQEDTKALAMPPDDRVRLYDDEGIAPARPNAMKKDPEKPVARRKRWARSLLLEYGELLSQRGVLGREMHSAMEAGDERAERREEGANHARRLGQPDDTGKPQFLRDISMFGVVASHSWEPYRFRAVGRPLLALSVARDERVSVDRLVLIRIIAAAGLTALAVRPARGEGVKCGPFKIGGEISISEPKGGAQAKITTSESDSAGKSWFTFVRVSDSIMKVRYTRPAQRLLGAADVTSEAVIVHSDDHKISFTDKDINGVYFYTIFFKEEVAVWTRHLRGLIMPARASTKVARCYPAD